MDAEVCSSLHLHRGLQQPTPTIRSLLNRRIREGSWPRQHSRRQHSHHRHILRSRAYRPSQKPPVSRMDSPQLLLSHRPISNIYSCVKFARARQTPHPYQDEKRRGKRWCGGAGRSREDGIPASCWTGHPCDLARCHEPVWP